MVGDMPPFPEHGGEIVFVEVKSRRSDRFGAPEESVTPAKAARLRAAAEGFLAQRGARPPAYRIDVIAIYGGADDRLVLRHLRSAVDAAD